MRFRTTVFLAGKTATGIVVPPEVVASFGVGKRPPVKVTINGYTYRSTVAVMGGDFMLPVAAEHREKAGLTAGDEIEVGLELDAEPRVVVVPEPLEQALARDEAAKKNFEALSNSRKRGYTLSIIGAKTEETRQRRVEKAIAELRAL
jgi:hypothetical protein